MRDGEWYLGYSSYDNLPGGALNFGTMASGIYCLTEPDVAFADPDVGDGAMPGEDGIRLGRDYQRAATVTFELGVDGVDGPVDRHYPMRPWARGARIGDWTDIELVMAYANKRGGPWDWASEGVDMLRQVWRADAIRMKPGRVSWLLHRTAGRTRRMYGRPRKFAVSHSRLTKQGYTPVVADFVAVDDRFYDEEEKSAEMWDFYTAGRPSRPWRPILNDGETYFTTSKKTATVRQLGRLPTYPVIVIYGPCKNPKVTLAPGLWSVQLAMTIAADDYVTIDPRPWARTVIHTKGSTTASAADKLTRASPRLGAMSIPPGNWTASLSYTRSTSKYLDGPRVELKWRDAFAWW
ncbi:hypothetical protein [Streptomyces sp. NPDC001536]|uniref:hypothetical protein n=1 Tax=Streptomyces sp. NPDC001536 TaxID=3364583 RepID=UPI00368A32D2